MLADDCLYELFEAAVDATAEAAIDSLCMATTVEGQGGNVAYALPLDRLVAVMNDLRTTRPPSRCGGRERVAGCRRHAWGWQRSTIASDLFAIVEVELSWWPMNGTSFR